MGEVRSTAVRVLGIDPGSRVTGFAVLERNGSKVAYVTSGCIRAGDGEFPARLKAIFDGVREIVSRYRPEEVALERVFMHRNPDSALKLGQARGAAMCAAIEGGLKVFEYTPSEVKQATVGKGNAAKAQVQHMVQALLGLSAVPQADAADALAIGLCHLHGRETALKIAAAAGASTPRRSAGRWR